MQNRQEAIQLMNRYGKEKRPFFFVIDFLQKKPLVYTLEDMKQEEMQCYMPHFSFQQDAELANQHISLEVESYSQGSYLSQLEHVVAHIKRGDSFLVNLTCQTPIQLNLPLLDIYHLAKAKYKLWYRDQFVVFSPETFVRIEKGEIASYPMKGTIDANIPNAEELILNNPKEKAEHFTIVDLIRNDLSMVAKDVKVTKFRYIEEIKTESGNLLQVSSEIKGQLPKDFAVRIGDILFKLLPAGSISGAPKNKTLEIIQETETYQRGYYTGIFGMFDGENLDSAVMIRFIEKTDKGLVYKSGGGITAFSKAEEEYMEMQKKIYVPIN